MKPEISTRLYNRQYLLWPFAIIMSVIGVVALGAIDVIDTQAFKTDNLTVTTNLTFTGATLVGRIADNLTDIVIGGGARFGTGGPNLTFAGGSTATTTSQVVIVDTPLHTAFEAIDLLIFGSGPSNYDTTLQAGTFWGVDSEPQVTHSAGANPLTFASYHCGGKILTPIGGDVTRCLEGPAGAGKIQIIDGASLGPTDISTSLITNGAATVDFTGSSSIGLNQNLTAPANKISMVGNSTNAPQFSLGAVPFNDGSQFATKNTTAGQLNGYLASLDTTVLSTISGGYYISRAAGGGGIVGGAQATNAGLMVAGTTSFQCVNNAVGDTCLFNFITGKALNFATSTATTRHVGFQLGTTGDFTIGGAPAEATSMIAGAMTAPTVNHGTLSADASNFAGRVTAIGANTSFTLTYGTNIFATTSHCHIQAATATAQVYTVTPSKTAPVISCFDMAGVAANCGDVEYECWGH